MTISKIEIQKLQASEGMILTNGKNFSSIGGRVYLGSAADASCWFEITPEQRAQLAASGKNVKAVEIA